MKKFLLSLSVAMLSFVGAWAQDFNLQTADVEGSSVRRATITLSGNWLDGANVEEMTTSLIDMIMGYVATPKVDGNGDPVYVLDGEGNPVQDVDANGEPLVDDENNPIYKREYNAPAYYPAKAFTDVTIKSASGIVTINNRLLQQLVTGRVTEAEGQLTWHTSENKVTRLDLSGVAVTGYVGNTGSDKRAADAICPANDSPVEYFAMPSFQVRDDQTYTIPSYVLNGLVHMDELILPANTKKVGTAAFAGLNYNKFKLNVGLEFIGNSAFHASSDRKGMETLDIPSSVKYIGPDAFWFRSFTDIYFHSAQAPICPVGYGVIEKADHAMLYNDCYMGNNGFTDSNEHAEKQNTGNPPNGRKDGKPGKANRENYMSEGKRWMVMVHFPSSAEMEAEGKTLDIASYKDVTRVYNKVYGNIYGSGNDAEKIEIAIPGHEQEYIERGKVWDEANSFDYVGKETTGLTYGSVTAAKDVNSGYEDTYRGLNYIWPSQSQWIRAFNTVALGYNWDGVTEYRPTLTPEQIALMVEDGLQVNMKQDGSGSGQWVAVGADITYDEAMANAYNATLKGAVHEGEAKEWFNEDDALAWNSDPEKNPGRVEVGGSKGTYTAEEAKAHNESLPTAIHEGDAKEKWTAEDAKTFNEGLSTAIHENDPIYPTAQEVLDHNADFEGAKHANDVKEEGYPTEFYTYEEMKSFDWINFSKEQYEDFIKGDVTNWNWNMGHTPIKTQGQPTTYYSAEEAAAYNAANHPEPWTESTVIGYVTAEQALAWNSNPETNPGCVAEGDTKVAYTAEEALAWNSNPATNPGCVAEGESKGEYTAEEAKAYNESLPTAKHEGDEKAWWTAEEANAENKKLAGAREAGFTSKSYDDPEVADLLSWVAFQSTRRCVFGANDGGGDHYDPKIPSSEAWWTICLPFDLTKAQIDKYFGEGTHVCLFNKVERKIENLAANERPHVKFYFTDDQYVGKTADQVVLEAHVPYMIYPTIKGAEGTADAVGKIPSSEYYIKTGNPIPTNITANDGEKYRFIGNYDTKLPVSNADGSVSTIDVVIPQYSYFYAKKKTDTKYKFWFIQSNNMKWAANKCIIQSTSADRGLSDNDTFFSEMAKQANGGETKQITILGNEIEDDEATAIDVIIVAGNGEDSQVIYNLNGQQLNVAPQHGIYIKNGKKYIAK